MKVNSHEIKSNSTVIHLMDYNAFNPMENLDQLTKQEQQRMLSFAHTGRRREFVATRVLRHQLFGLKNIEYTRVGAPYIKGEGYISISHSKSLVGIAVSQNYKIGLDLETPRDTILEVAPKFLSKIEAQQFDITDKAEITKVWSCKEALYKLAGRKKIIFKTDLLLSKDEINSWNGQIVNLDHDLYVKMDIFEYNNTVVSINSGAVDKVFRNI